MTASVIRLFPLSQVRVAGPARHRVGLLRRLLMRVDRLLCGLWGHDMVLGHSADRLWLRCLCCGAETQGWALEVRSDFRQPDAGRGRVLHHHARTQSPAAAQAA